MDSRTSKRAGAGPFFERVESARIATDPRVNVIGISKEQVLAALWFSSKGTTEVWSYNSENNVTPAKDGDGHYRTLT
jgi:hypothetical protein